MAGYPVSRPACSYHSRPPPACSSTERTRNCPSRLAKRKALEAVYQGIVTSDLPEWNRDPGLLDWLADL
jgi:hypothetical protein